MKGKSISRPVKMGRPLIELNLIVVKEMLRDRPLTQVAESLGVHRNTLYRRIEKDALWRECIKTSRQAKTPAFYQPINILYFFPQAIARTCKSCSEAKPLAEFPHRKMRGDYRTVCKICTRQRWNALQLEKRRIRDEGRRKQIAKVFAVLNEVVWQIGCFYRGAKSRFIVRYIGRPEIKMNLKKLETDLRANEKSVIQLAQERGVHRNTIYYRIKRYQLVDIPFYKKRVRVKRRAKIYSPYMPEVDIAHLSPEELIAIVEKTIPYSITPSVRADFRQEIIIALFSGELELKNLLWEMPELIYRFRKQYFITYFSLDVPISKYDGERYGEGTTLAGNII